jgi:signal transduction histidine kinase
MIKTDSLPEILPEELKAYWMSITRIAAVGLLSSSIMHEIRNGLSVISGNIQILMMKSGKATPEEVDQYLHRMMTQMERIEQALARVESFSCRTGGVLSKVRPDKAIDNAIFATQRHGDMKGIQIQKQIEATDKTVLCDESLFEFVLMELLFNSFKNGEKDETLKLFSQDDGVNWRFRLECWKTSGKPQTYKPRKDDYAMITSILAAEKMGGEMKRLDEQTHGGWTFQMPWAENEESSDKRDA